MTDNVFEFKTEVKQLLDLMIHSLYSHKEIFLRELISNASDAIDRLRYESLTNPSLLQGETEWRITIQADKTDGKLTIRDNGIGMNRAEIITALGTIAHSGTRDFLNRLREQDIKDHPELIGQFGVGFYSAFMVADRVVVVSRKAGEPRENAVRWESKADGTYTVEAFEKDQHGTDVILYLKEEERRFTDEWEIRSVVRKYSDYVEHPIYMPVTRDNKTEEQILNSRKALWLKDKSEITAEEYNEFYKHIAHDITDPLRVIHFKAEGTTEFAALLFIPARAPFDLFYREAKIGPKLYVRRVQIMDHCEELLPSYLRFVKGVVESSDLPLNVSREILQANKQIEIIRKNITKKVLDTLTDLKEKERETYLKFYQEFRKPLKEGLYTDPSRKDSIRELLLFESTSTKPGELTSLKDYVSRMKEGQEAIYTISGLSRAELESSPYLETFREKNYEVLFLLDEIDDFIASELDYSNKPVRSVLKGDIKIDESKEAAQQEAGRKYDKLLDLIRNELKEEVKDVRFSGRLTDSLCCLVAGEDDMDPNMERILKALGQNVTHQKRILEINPSHPLLNSMQRIFDRDQTMPVLKDYVALLYDQALILEGNKPKDPARHARLMTKLMAEHSEKI